MRPSTLGDQWHSASPGCLDQQVSYRAAWHTEHRPASQSCWATSRLAPADPLLVRQRHPPQEHLQHAIDVAEVQHQPANSHGSTHAPASGECINDTVQSLDNGAMILCQMEMGPCPRGKGAQKLQATCPGPSRAIWLGPALLFAWCCSHCRTSYLVHLTRRGQHLWRSPTPDAVPSQQAAIALSAAKNDKLIWRGTVPTLEPALRSTITSARQHHWVQDSQVCQVPPAQHAACHRMQSFGHAL